MTIKITGAEAIVTVTKPVSEALRVARYLQRRSQIGGMPDRIDRVVELNGEVARPLQASDLQALLDYIREV